MNATGSEATQPRGGSAARLRGLRPDELSADQRRLYEAITSGPRAAGPRLFELTDETGRLTGPFDAMLRSPTVGGALQELGSAVRYSSGLSARVREIAILLVAARWDCAYERHAHEAVGRDVGLTEGELDQIRHGRPPASGDPLERAAAEVVQALLTDGDLADEAYETARDTLGERALFELSTLVGYYTTLALQLRLFRVPAPS